MCVGINYGNRDAEYGNSIKGEYPNIFLRTPETLAAHNQAMLVPPESEQLDYEGEIALVIGKGGRRIPRESALDHIGAVTCLNEGCIRDWMRHGKLNITQGKNFYRCGSVGPWMVTADEFSDGYDDMRVTTRVNGECVRTIRRQISSTIFRILLPMRPPGIPWNLATSFPPERRRVPAPASIRPPGSATGMLPKSKYQALESCRIPSRTRPFKADFMSIAVEGRQAVLYTPPTFKNRTNTNLTNGFSS